LIADGILPRNEVDAALEFRDKVLEHFETFVLENIACKEEPAPTLLFAFAETSGIDFVGASNNP
jgi:hypothetical protein